MYHQCGVKINYATYMHGKLQRKIITMNIRPQHAANTSVKKCSN